MPLEDAFWRRMFFVASLYTLSAGPSLAVSYRCFPGLLFSADGLAFVPNPVFGTFFYTLALAVVLFGLGYYAVSRDPTRNRAVVWMGLLGKLGLAALVVPLYVAGFLTPALPLGVAGDVVWAALYFVFLRKTRSRVAVSDLVG